MDEDSIGDEQLAALGLIRIPQSQPDRIGEYDGELRPIEIHSVRPLRRVSPDRRIHTDLIFEITQSFRPTEMPGVRLRGGCTLIIDLASADVRYMVLKKVDNAWRLKNQLEFVRKAGDLRGNYFDEATSTREPFATIHHEHG